MKKSVTPFSFKMRLLCNSRNSVIFDKISNFLNTTKTLIKSQYYTKSGSLATIRRCKIQVPSQLKGNLGYNLYSGPHWAVKVVPPIIWYHLIRYVTLFASEGFSPTIYFYLKTNLLHCNITIEEKTFDLTLLQILNSSLGECHYLLPLFLH